MNKYLKRTWLNGEEISSTGSVAAYHGPSSWDDENGEQVTDMFLEVSDCNCKARLHKSRFETTEHYIKKIKLLNGCIMEYIEFLEKEYDQS